MAYWNAAARSSALRCRRGCDRNSGAPASSMLSPREPRQIAGHPMVLPDAPRHAVPSVRSFLAGQPACIVVLMDVSTFASTNVHEPSLCRMPVTCAILRFRLTTKIVRTAWTLTEEASHRRQGFGSAGICRQGILDHRGRQGPPYQGLQPDRNHPLIREIFAPQAESLSSRRSKPRSRW
jgi:hypothetical protein